MHLSASAGGAGGNVGGAVGGVDIAANAGNGVGSLKEAALMATGRGQRLVSVNVGEVRPQTQT